MEKENSKNIKKIVYPIMSLLLFIVVIILIVIFFLNGSTTVNKSSKTEVVAGSLACESTEVEYPFFSFNESNKKSMKINVIFEDEKINTLSLAYRLYYNSSDEILKSETINHANMNENFASDGFSADSFDAVYAILNDSLQLTINTSGNKLNGVVAKYFLLNDATSYKKDYLKKYYESRGFSCKDND